MTYKTKRSLAQLGKHGAKKLKVHHPDEAPAPATERGRYGWPAPVAADAPPPSAHGPAWFQLISILTSHCTNAGDRPPLFASHCRVQ